MPRFSIPEQELVYSGHVACPGCGGGLAIRYMLKALGPKTIVSIPACCWAITSGPFPRTALKVPTLDTAFEATGASISGLRAALDALGMKDITVVGYAGDGGTADIGIQALSGMIERNTDAIYFMYDNEAYMNTGIQRSSATPFGAWTTTTPADMDGTWKTEPKKSMMAIVVAHKIPYAATVSIGFPEDFVRKVEKAKNIKGPRFIHAFCPCPPGWKYSPENTIKLAKLGVNANVFPLYEVENGVYKISMKPSKPRPVKEYLESQGRFKHLKDEMIAQMQERTDRTWNNLLALEGFSKEHPYGGL
jgi:2-oxoisovalerate ferredoxin oxidoreductase beta subunit